jgi:hypothetical protein
MANAERQTNAERSSDADAFNGQEHDATLDPAGEGANAASELQYVPIDPIWDIVLGGRKSHVSVLMREYEYPAETIKEINRINKYKKRGARLVIAPQSVKQMVDGVIAAAGSNKIDGLAINAHGGSGYIHSGADNVVLGHTNTGTWVGEIKRLAAVLRKGSCIYLSGCGSGMGFDGLQFGKAFAEALPGVRIHAGVNLNFTAEKHEDSPFSAAEMYEGSYHVFSSEGGQLTVEDHYKRGDGEFFYWGPILGSAGRSRASRLGLLLLDASGLGAAVSEEKAAVAGQKGLSKAERAGAKAEVRAAGVATAQTLGESLLKLIAEYDGETNKAQLAIDLADVYSTRDIEALADLIFNGEIDAQYMQYAAETATILRDVPALQRGLAAGKIRGAGKALQQYLAQQKITIKNTPLRN